jgi:hypothetical protein
MLGMALMAGMLLSLGACGKAAVNGPVTDYSEGTVNVGADKDTGTVNTGADQDRGVINTGATENVDGTIPNGSTGLTDATGKCINDTDKDLTCNEVDPDIDGDKIINTLDPDIDNDGMINTQDPDIDGDGVLNVDDADIDGDGIANVNDSDIDSDGITNTQDPDMDGDGTLNINDNDIDGDGIINTTDPDIDGDGIINTQDPDMDGDGIFNTNDNDIDGDGIINTTDPDMDGDGIINTTDPDIDGDGILNTLDPDPNGDGQIENPIGTSSGSSSASTGGSILAYFNDTNSIDMDVLAGVTGGSGSKYLAFQNIRDSAKAKNAAVGTINPYSISVKLDAPSAAAMAPYATTTFRMKVFYTLDGGAKTLIGATDASNPLPISALTAGIGMDDGKGTLLPTENYSGFQLAIANPTLAGATMTVEVSDLSSTLPALSLRLDYIVKANALVNP